MNKLTRSLIIISGILILMVLGTSYSWGVFLLPITSDTGWTRTEVSMAVSILLLTFSLFMPIGGFLEKKLGPRITVEIGAFFVGIGWILSSYSLSPLWLYLFYGLLVGIGTGFCYMPPISCGIKWFQNNKGFATGAILLGFGAGSAFLSPIITFVINLYGWRTTMAILGIVFSILIIILAQSLKNPDEEITLQNTKDSKANLSPLQMIKTLDFKIIFLTYIMAMFSAMLTTNHIVAILNNKNFSMIQSTLSLSFLSLSNGFGRILIGTISDFLGRKKITILLFIILGISIICLNFSNSLFIIYFLSILIGLCFGGFLAIYPAITSELFGNRDFSINYGIVFIGYGIGCFLGPIFGGYIFDLTKSYQSALILSGIIPLLGTIIIQFYYRKPKYEKY